MVNRKGNRVNRAKREKRFGMLKCVPFRVWGFLCVAGEGQDVPLWLLEAVVLFSW